MDGIRLGTIGSGTIVRSILDAVRATPGIRLEAVYSRSPEKAERLAADYGAASVYSDMDAFLSDPAVNFVYIATPNSLHFAQAKRSLLAGKNVILEKPFCPCAEEAAELVALARENGLFLVDATPTAFLPGLGILRRELPALGRIRAVQANYSQYSSRLARLAAGFLPPVFDPAFCGGCLMDLGYYNVYLNAALFGRPRAVRYEPRFLSESFFADAGNAPDAAKRPRTADIAGTLTLDYGDFTSTNFAAKDIPGVSFFQISGEDINSPRQSFVCEAQRAPEFSNLYEATWALIAHEWRSTANPKDGLFSKEAIANWPDLKQRVAEFARFGQGMWA